MKVILQKGSGKTAPLGRQSDLSLRTPPVDFEIRLLERILAELRERPRESGDAPILSHPDIDLSEVQKAIRSRDLKRILDVTSALNAQSIATRWANQPDIAFGLYQIHTLLKKFPVSGDECAMKAYHSFLQYERHCSLYNTENYKAILALNKRHPDYLGIIEEIREDIRRCIGDAPNVKSVIDNAKHGPGTSIGLRGDMGMVTSYFKWSTLPYTVSLGALPLAREAIATDPRWVGALFDRFRAEHDLLAQSLVNIEEFWSWVFEVCDYCRYSTVPKSAVTDRSIGVEPTMNVFLQLGCDRIIRRNLKYRWGIDLNTQKKNQQLAAESSVTDEDATIDLKGASDCVALMACYLLLPEQWVGLLLDLRSENILISDRYAIRKTEKPLAKMSAMGNGFTFALESLIFAALARVVMRRLKIKGNLAVFGDDIIVPKAAAPRLIDLLSLFGFDVNVEKTFVSGPFRESCGVDCLNGINIRPLFLKRPIQTVMDLFYVHNMLYVLERRLPEIWEVSFKDTRAWLRSYLPRQYREVCGPPSESLDTYLFVNNVPYDCNGRYKHLCLTPLSPNYNGRAPDFYFRKLMATLAPTHTDSQERLQDFRLAKLFFEGVGESLQKGWKTGGSVRDNMKHSPSCFDVTLRGNVEIILHYRFAWRR